MEDGFKNIDELLRGSLGDYNKPPSPKVWKGVSKSLFYSGLTKYILVAFGILAISTAAYLYLGYTNTVNVPDYSANIENNIKNTNDPSVIDELIIEKSDNAIDDNKNKTSTSQSLDKGSEINRTETIISENNSKSGKVDTPKKAIATAPLLTNEKSAIVEPSSKATIEDRPVDDIPANITYPGIPGLLDNSHISGMPSSHIHSNTIFIDYYTMDIITGRNNFNGMPAVSKLDYGSDKSFSYGLYISPEIIFTNDEENSKKLQVNMDAVVNYKTNEDFYLQGGIGIGISQDDGRYSVDYSQYDSIGYYYEVNSFTIDPITGKPVFKTTVENVYDTVDYNTLTLTGNRYTYFRLSGFFGYKVHSVKRFSVFVKGGLTYSILAKTYEPNPGYTNDDAINIEITNETPQRIQDTWQLSAGLGFHYRLSNNLVISGEPVYNYYLRPVYEQRLNTKSPYSIGLRVGLLFKF
ncbi:MAG: hypothetical protein DRJ05_01305 [Bacteroidetes bacterium]|nr:MAG: hypothetical protein DRJ05_01305 [Bacteroidota bacterium]